MGRPTPDGVWRARDERSAWEPPRLVVSTSPWPPPASGTAFDGSPPHHRWLRHRWLSARGSRAGKPGRRPRLWPTFAAGAAAVGVLTLVGTQIVSDATDSTPSDWDPAITDLVAFVERERELTFEHPVAVNFLSEVEFLALFQQPDELPDEQAFADEADMYGSLGLANDYDPSTDPATMEEVLILGFYDPESDQVFVRGSDLTPEVRTVLVHELTHVLQSQHFSLQLGGSDDLVNRSLLEGDAIRIEERYIATLSDSTQEAVEHATSLDAGDTAQLSDVPWTVTEAEFAPYVLGPSFVTTLESEGGNATVDEAMRLPPTPEQLLDPLQYLNPPATAGTTSQPPIQSSTPPGAESIYLSSPFGLFEAMVMLDAWLPWYQTRRALDGWDDAAISVFRTNGVVCSAITIRVDDRASAGRLAEALRDWSEATSSSVRPTISEGAGGHPEVSFTPCADVTRGTPPAPAITPSYAVGFETSFVQDVLATDDGISPNVARCVARQLVDDETFLDLIDVYEWTPEQDDLYAQTVETLRTRCERFREADPIQP